MLGMLFSDVRDRRMPGNGYAITELDLLGADNNDGDLYYSIHKSDICLTGYKRNDGKWIINAVLEDEYDFTKIQSFMDDSGGWSKQASKGTVANDLAVISQKTGAINPYHVTVNFWTMR